MSLEHPVPTGETWRPTGFGHASKMQLPNSVLKNPDEQKNAPELPIGRFLKSRSPGGNRVILDVTRTISC